MPELGEIKRGERSRLYIWVACNMCGKERWVRYLVTKGEPIRLRCKPCAHEGKKGENNVNWNGGRVICEGYVLIKLQPDDFFYPMAAKSGYVREHRLVVAKALGRNLHLWEIVHHKHAKYPAGSIEDKQDNRYPENLQLVSDDRHKQISILEKRIKLLESRVTLLEAENIVLKQQIGV